MKLLGLDVGTKRIGVAFCDTNIGIVFPRDVIIIKSEEKAIEEIKNVIIKDKIDKIIVGMPLNFNSTKSKIQEHVESFCQKLKTKVNIDIEFFDERFTTKIAGGITNKNIDSISASLILEDYLKTTQKEDYH